MLRATLLLATGSWVSCRCESPPAPAALAIDDASPVLIVGPHDPSDVGVRRAGGDSYSLALATMPDVRRDAITDHAARVASGVHAAKNPLVVDLDDQPLSARASDLRRDLLPAASAAEALLAEQWRSVDGALAVRAAEHCPRDTRCLPAWDTPGAMTPEDRAARLAAWPVTAAIVLEAPTARDARDLGARLRAAAPDIEGVALVVTASPTPPTPASVRDVEGLLVSAGELDPGGHLPTNIPPVPDWLHARHVLVVVRFGALGRLDGVARDVETQLHQLELPYDVSIVNRGCGFGAGGTRCEAPTTSRATGL